MGRVESVRLVEGRVEVDSETVTVYEEEAFVEAGLMWYEGMYSRTEVDTTFTVEADWGLLRCIDAQTSRLWCLGSPLQRLLWIRVQDEEVGIRLIRTLNPFDLTKEGEHVDVLFKLPFVEGLEATKAAVEGNFRGVSVHLKDVEN